MASNTAENSPLSPGLTLAVIHITESANVGSIRRRTVLRRGLASPLWTLINKTTGKIHLSEDGGHQTLPLGITSALKS
jgi:hypothetical protein